MYTTQMAARHTCIICTFQLCLTVSADLVKWKFAGISRPLFLPQLSLYPAQISFKFQLLVTLDHTKVFLNKINK